jgi:hypothetical protein
MDIDQNGTQNIREDRSNPMAIPSGAQNPAMTVMWEAAMGVMKDASMKFKVERPPTFHGTKRTRTAIDWLNKMERYLVLTKVPDDAKTMFASSYLDRTAAEWFDTMVPAQYKQVGYTWPAFRELFAARFREVNDETKQITEFFRISQASTKDGSMEGYIERFTELYTVLGSQINESVAKQRFIDGLKPLTQQDVRRGNPKSLNDAILLADEAEDAFTRRHSEKERGNPKTENFKKKKPQKSENADDSRSGVTKAEMRRKGLCFKCHEQGHMASDCPKNEKANESKNERV